MNNDFFEQFKGYLSTTKKCSKNTLDAYLRDVSQFITYCSQNGFKNTTDVNSDFLVKYIEHITFLGKSEATITRIIASLHSYFNFLVSEGIITSDPTKAIKGPKNTRKIPDVLDTKESTLLLSQPNGDDYKSIRDKAMLE